MDKEAKITVGKVTSQIIDRIENLSDSQKGAELFEIQLENLLLKQMMYGLFYLDICQKIF